MFEILVKFFKIKSWEFLWDTINDNSQGNKAETIPRRERTLGIKKGQDSSTAWRNRKVP